ncbi:hypothetical protein [Ktedonobacter robiniae]|uniref:Uncharacterized protein n=1 Tax=Ktedonobacter robiniae TaxID=2778365 RepID=A0ABQ3V999_9CHLR|nr:hypothetical protein [Ktedonobacter robiniae]GHO61107.1 hypothetical protein KSB_95820 [Ktedonobacter robiniae]
MQDKKLASTSKAILSFTLCFGIFCTLCSTCSIFSNAYMGPDEWLKVFANEFQQGHLYFNEDGIGLFILGFFIVGIMSLLTFAFAFRAYRRKEGGKKSMVWAMLLFGVAALVIVGAFALRTHSSCHEDPEGSDDTVYCTYALPGSQPFTPTP